MNCSPLQDPPTTMIPAGMRDWIGAKLSGPPPGPHRSQGRACLFALGRIGDFVLSLGALRRLVQEFGPGHCVLVVPSRMNFLVAREFPGVECIYLPGEGSSLVRQIIPAWRHERPKFAQEHFTQRICLSHQRSLYYEVALTWIDAARDVRLMPATYPATAEEGACTELLAHQRLVEMVLGQPVPRAEIMPHLTSYAVGHDGRQLVYPLSRDARRCIGTNALTAILQAWRRSCVAPIVLGGSPTEADQLQRYAAEARRAGVRNVTVETPDLVDGLIAQVAAAGGVLASDSAAAHLAAALDKPSLVLQSDYLRGYCQPWRNSERQRYLPADTPPETIAAALPAL